MKLIKVIKHEASLGQKESPSTAAVSQATEQNLAEATKIVYPFFAHVDFSLCPKTQSGNFEQKLVKLQNGLFRFEKESPMPTQKHSNSSNIYAAKAYTSVVKSGCRFQDELVELQVEVRSQDG